MKHLLVTALCVVVVSTGCEKATHENIEKWERTEKGPTKLKKALTSDLDPGLRAHAAQVLIRIGELDAVVEVLESARDGEQLMTELESRLWADAEIKGAAMARPSGLQVGAKDALFDLREYANGATQTQLDAHLVEWLTGGYFEGRSRTGRHSSRRIVRAIGQGAGPALVGAAQGVLAKPTNPDGSSERIGDELLASLAFSGHPKAIGLLLDLVESSEQRDKTVPKRAMNALFKAYIDPDAGIEKAPGKYLQSVADRLEALGKNEAVDGRMANDALDLLAATGMPGCLKPFVSFVSYPHSQEALRYVGTARGIRCAGVDGIVPITEALPPTVAYERGILNKYLWREVLALPAQKVVAEKARSLLAADNWVARVSGIELLGALARKDSAKADAALIAKLKGDRKKLRGWWGKDSKKADPTLGQVANEVAAKLEAL